MQAVIQEPTTSRVVPLVLRERDDAVTGVLIVPQFGAEVERVILAIAAMTPATPERAPYTVTSQFTSDLSGLP